MIIEKLLEFIEKELSDNKILYSNFKKRWLAVSYLLPFSSVAVSIMLIIYCGKGFLEYWPWYISLSLIIIMIVAICVRYTKRKILIVLRMHSLKYRFYVPNNWSYYTIIELKLKKMNAYFLNHPHFSPEKIGQIIESLKAERSKLTYKSQSIPIIATFIGLPVSAFLAPVFNQGKTWFDWLMLLKPFLAIMFLLGIFIIYLDFYFFKRIHDWRVGKYDRAIRLLENYRLTYH